MYAGAKALFHALSRSGTLRRLTTRYGMAGASGFARRFVAGETMAEAMAAAHVLQARGLTLTLDYLGESVRSRAGAEAAVGEYLRLVEAIAAAGVERNISLKLTQLGIDIDQRTCLDNLRRVLDATARHDCFVRIDMEDSPHTQPTLDVFESLWQEGHRGVGVALQACLHRTPGDVRRMNTLGARVRLVKGAYKEPAAVAHQDKAAVDAAFAELTRLLLDEGTYPAIATHDEALIAATRTHAAARRYPPSRFEFQLLYGIRRDLQAALVADGYRVRVYVPFGREWFPYFMRRLGERPANVGFVLRSLVRER